MRFVVDARGIELSGRDAKSWVQYQSVDVKKRCWSKGCSKIDCMVCVTAISWVVVCRREETTARVGGERM
jgi:hypothetical protein